MKGLMMFMMVQNPTQYTTLEDAQGFCNNYNKQLNI